MPNQKKKKEIQNAQIPVFTSTCNYIPENTSKDSVITSVPRSEIEQKLDFYRKKAAVPNMVKATQNWTKKFNEFRHHYNYVTPIETIEDPHLIEQQICEFIVQMTKKDKGEYKAKTVKQAIDRINKYISKTSIIRGLNLHDKYQFPDLHDILNGKIKDLQERGFGEKEGSIALTAQQVKEILSDDKNNQREIQGGNAHCIQLLPNSSDIPGPVSNFTKYISKRPLGQKVKVKLPDGILTNHSGRKTAAQILQDADIPEDAIINITEHKSSQGLRVYKTINESQKVNTIKTLINTIEPASNTNIISQESPIVLTEITGSQINFNTNTVTTQDINMVQGQIHSEFQNQ
ncbi:8373_t:CDS:2, partial [Racocetra persica]